MKKNLAIFLFVLLAPLSAHAAEADMYCQVLNWLGVGNQFTPYNTGTTASAAVANTVLAANTLIFQYSCPAS